MGKFPAHIALHITHNEYVTYYGDGVEEFLAAADIGPDEWASEDSEALIVETGDVWEAVWWPSTPVSHCRLFAASFPALIQALEAVT